MGWGEHPNIPPVPASPGFLPFPRGGSRHGTHRGCRMGAAQCREQEAAAERLLFLNQTQRAFPDSAQARSGITQRQACSGQWRA